ncbi:tetratricopeptide repeat protein [Tepidiforma flava]|uniref:Tetratricopeptide repeat protein n=1 Tax=Tepidiforma flava TaxID=3004094 RepID=A0ABY7M790_9CHLR|nr:tetratricopeptide repeat protein [Tepidiforma flava]WBL36270.1 tetratricopeptide repeat protein [Tepidiforma flava]
MLGPVIEKVAAENEGRVVLAKLNTDENPRTAMQYRIQGIPAVKAFKDGKVIAEFTGAYPEPQVRAFFQKVIGAAGSGASTADDLLRKGDVAGAEREYRAILEKSPNDAGAIVGLATILLARGARSEAEKLLERAPTDRRAKALKHRIFLDEFRQKHAGEDLEGEARRNPRDPRARYRWGVMLAAQEKYEQALDELLESVRLDRTFADGAARKAMLAIFDILGLDSPSPASTSAASPASSSDGALSGPAAPIARTPVPGDNRANITSRDRP